MESETVSILSLCFDSATAGPGPTATTGSGLDESSSASSGFAEVLTDRPRSLLVGSATTVGTISLNAFKVEHVVSLHDAAVGSGLDRDTDVRVAAGYSFRALAPRSVGAAAGCQSFGCIATAAFDRRLARFTVTLPDAVAPPAAGLLSMMAVDELAEDSPLKASMTLVAKATPKKTGVGAGRATPAKKGGGGVRDSPVTFGRKIKSSGYAQAKKGPQKLFQPKTDFGKKRTPAGKAALPKPDFTKGRAPKKSGAIPVESGVSGRSPACVVLCRLCVYTDMPCSF